MRCLAFWMVLIGVTLSAAWAQQPAKDPMPLGVAFGNVREACVLASEELLVGKQARVLSESMDTILAALMIYEQYVTTQK